MIKENTYTIIFNIHFFLYLFLFFKYFKKSSFESDIKKYDSN